ncbi:MAG: leucine-rich repeat domain-containing protein [Bacteroidaceae bacterium]|nr:leucine-rich repeat domain-containing protein [Bacteroidaceae bacterium]
MNKRSYIFLTMAALLGGCASDDYIGDIPLNGGDVITMGMKEKKITRADKTGADAAADLGNNFVVAGYRKAGTATDCIFDHYNVNYLKSSAKSTVSNTTGWEYVGQAVNSLSTAKEQTVKYWDTSADNYYFVAFSKGQGVADASGNKTYATFGKVVEEELGDDDVLDELNATTSAFTITGTVDQLNEAYFSDLLSVAKADFKTTTVTPRFRRVGAKLRIALYETIPGYSVTDVKFYTKDNDADPDDTPKLYASDDIFPTGTGTVYVGYPNKDKSTENYYLKALTSFKSDSGDHTSSLSFSPLTYGALEKHEKVTGDVYLGRTTATASYSGETAAEAYINVTPSSGTSILPLTLKCDYTLVPVDGAGETIHVFGATALVPPAYTNWASNYAYTYIFKITDQTDGKAGTSETDYAGLYPITFDAVEKTDVDDGYEETVSTLGSQAPTITTYQKGAAITENGDNIYNAGVIYVTVYDNEVKALTVGKTSVSNISLFEITQEGGKKGGITETVVKSCIEDANNYTLDSYGPFSYDPNNTANKVSLTRVDSKLTAVDKILSVDSPFGTDITVNGAKFTAEENKQYAIQYKNAEGKYTYKVLGVGDIKMYYYVNYKARLLDLSGNPDDIWDGVDDSGYTNGILNNINDPSKTYLDGWGFTGISLADKVSFGDAKLLIPESKSKFDNTTGLGQFVFEGSPTTIEFAFFDLPELLWIDLPATLTSIGRVAFAMCRGLTDISIPNQVQSIGDNAFKRCVNLKSVDLSKCTKLSSIGASAFNSCISLNNVVLPNSVKTLGSLAFYECDALTNIKLNEGLETVGENAFANCNLLSELVIPSTVTTIGKNTFDASQNISTIYLPEYMTGTLNGAAFANCGHNATSTNVVLYECDEIVGDLEIGSTCFSGIGPTGNSGMIVLPRNITKLDGNVFGPSFKTIVFLSGNPPIISNDTFSNLATGTKIYVPTGCSSAYSTAWGDKIKDSKGNPYAEIVEGTPPGFKIYTKSELP